MFHFHNVRREGLFTSSSCALVIDYGGEEIFINEKMFVDCFINTLNSTPSPWGQVDYATEFFYHRGRTDLVAISESGEVIAFEAKLKKWRTALQQAYRNRCFADLSYVLLPAESAKIASKYLGEFALRGVGLCCISNGDLEVLFDAEQSEPLQPWLRQQAVLHVNGEG